MMASSQAAAQKIVADRGSDEQAEQGLKNRLAVVAALIALGLVIRGGLSLMSVPAMAVADVAALIMLGQLFSFVRTDRLPAAWLVPCAFGEA